MQVIQVKIYKDKEVVNIDNLNVPNDGWWHDYFDEEQGLVMILTASEENPHLTKIHPYVKYEENQHMHKVHFDVEFVGEPNYDYDEDGDYLPHWSGWYVKGGEIKQFHEHNQEEKAVMLNGGKFLINKFGKYEPDLCFITQKPWVPWKKIDRKELNLPDGDIEVLYGRFFVSKKGTKVFDTTAPATHLLVADGWGGAFNGYRGRTLPEEQAQFYKRAHSNGGGCGCDYAVFKAAWRYEISIDDL